MTRGKAPDPLLIARCSCGAIWLGRYAVDNEIIEFHRARPTCTVDGPRDMTDDELRTHKRGIYAKGKVVTL